MRASGAASQLSPSALTKNARRSLVIPHVEACKYVLPKPIKIYYPGEDPYAIDAKRLEDSRKKVLALADYIIPGHGKMFGGKRKKK